MKSGIEIPARTTCCIAGGGPAGMMLGLLLARAGVDTMVLEKHKDFLRDFRGDTVHPSTLQVLDDLGLIDKLLALRHSEVHKVQILTAQGLFTVGDFERLHAKYRFIALVPQWDFLAMIAEEAKKYPNFRLLMEAEALELYYEEDRIAGLRFAFEGEHQLVRTDLTVAADGRHSVLREHAKLPVIESSPPMDVLWFSLPREPSDAKDIIFRAGGGKLIAFIDRFDYWQVGFVIQKGAAQDVLSHGVDQVKRGLRELAPEMTDRLDTLKNVDQIKLLTVQSNRLLRWWMPGLLFIGDAAHAMTPVGGVGINLAIQDAVAAANRLWRELRCRDVRNASLAAVQRRRTWPTIATQALQTMVQKLIVHSAFRSTGPINVPGPLRLLLRAPIIRDLPPRFFGLGVRPERPSAELLAADSCS
jgi:2-polyprenyl-6-methoxyphenol hydroxylase-like FAD-dependent oxidoreductase